MSTPGDRRLGATDSSGPVAFVDLERALGLLGGADALRVEAASLLGPLADSGVAEWLGYVSLERHVAHRTRSGDGPARELLRVARFLDAHQVTAAAVRTGEVSWTHAESLARAATGDRANTFAAYERELLAAAQTREPEAFDRLLHTWRGRVDAEADAADAERTWRQRSLTMQLAFDGSSHGRFRLDPIATEIVAAALDTPPDPIGTLPEPRTLAQRRADTLVDLCRDDHPSADGNSCCGGGGTRATVDIFIDIDIDIDIETLADSDTITVQRLRRELGRGGPITGPGLDRLLCDASFRALITDGPHTVLASNRATPNIPPVLRRLVQIRHQHCTFPGCDRSWTWCEAPSLRSSRPPHHPTPPRRPHHRRQPHPPLPPPHHHPRRPLAPHPSTQRHHPGPQPLTQPTHNKRQH